MYAATRRRAFVAHRGRRGFLFAGTAQHVKSRRSGRDLSGAAAMLLGVASWAALFALLAG
jgi:hypothetical protein